MPDPSLALVTEALTRLASSADGLPLVTSKAGTGAFPSGVRGKAGAEYCQSKGLVRFVRRVPLGRGRVDHFTISEDGLAWLSKQAGLQPALSTLAAEVLAAELASWHAAHPLMDCPLPGLYALARGRLSGLTLGQFHDACRRLLERGRIHVHAWTGPLYEMPDPACAFLWGHEIAYYASLQRPGRHSPPRAAARPE